MITIPGMGTVRSPYLGLGQGPEQVELGLRVSTLHFAEVPRGGDAEIARTIPFSRSFVEAIKKHACNPHLTHEKLPVQQSL